MIDSIAIAARFDALSPFLDERERRLFAASEARVVGRGGVAAVSRATGIARSTIGRGLADLRAGAEQLGDRVRRAGGGGKPAIETQPGLLEALNELVQSSIRGDPEAALLWVSKSQRRLSAALAERGFTAGQKLVGRLLRRLGFSLQANSKTREGVSHPDRNAQFEHINAEVKAFQAAGEPAISVDTKKKELVGDFEDRGRELRPKGQPGAGRVRDFESPVSARRYPVASTTSPTMPDGSIWACRPRARCSPSRASARRGATGCRPLSHRDAAADHRGLRWRRRRAVAPWKRELQVLADELGITISVYHLPPGTTVNRIEHRLFAFITQNWRGKPLVDTSHHSIDRQYDH